MTNKEKYRNAKVVHFQPYGFYIYLGNSMYLVDGKPSPSRYYQTEKEAQKALDDFMKPVKKKPNTQTGGFEGFLDETLFDPTCYELVKEVVVKNHLGQEYIAQDCGRFWKFGCAEISKQQIKDLYNIMSSKNYGGNRTISKVTIGAADFSLDTLKALVDNGG